MKNILLSLLLGLALFGCKADEEVKAEKTEIVRVYFKVEATTSLSFATYYVYPNGVEGQRTSLSPFLNNVKNQLVSVSGIRITRS